MKKILTIFSAALLLMACTEKLNIDQHGTFDDSNYYKTDSEAESAITAVYCAMSGLEWPYQTVNGYLSDEYWSGQNQRMPMLDALIEYSFSYDHEMISSYFTSLYSIIARANLVIEKVPSDSPFKNQAIAEAKVFRAWMYFELASMWGEAPLVDHVVSSSEEAPSSATAAELWAFAEKDLTEAIESGYLTQKNSLDDRSNYRITKQYAQALLGKVYLWQGKNAEAARVLDEVIGSGLYGLYQGTYGDLYNVENENCPEFLFETNRVDDMNNPNLSFAVFFNGFCAYSRTVAATQNPLELCIVWGGLLPRKSVYDAFEAEEGPEGYRFHESVKSNEDMIALGYGIDATAIEYSEGCYQWKGRWDKNDFNDGTSSVFKNIRWMRYAEVLLMAAEANIGIDQSKADRYLNEVRTRAHLADKTCTLEAIKTERRLELLGDFCRYKDLQRWGDAATVLGENGKLEPILSIRGVEWKNFSTQYGYKQGKHEFLPIPNEEIIANRNIKQHEGWN